jgi:hypothetical protein
MLSLSRRPGGIPFLIVVICAVAFLSAPVERARAASQPAYDHPKFASLWRDATRPAGVSVTEYPDFTMVKSKDGLTLYYFTKRNHFAHPGIVKRTMTQNRGGGWNVSIDGTSFAANRNDPRFLKWLQQFKELNRKLQKAIEDDYGKPP